MLSGLLEVYFSYCNHSCPSVGWLVCHNFLSKGRKLHFHVPVGEKETMKFCWKKNGKEVELVFQEENGLLRIKEMGEKKGILSLRKNMPS